MDNYNSGFFELQDFHKIRINVTGQELINFSILG